MKLWYSTTSPFARKVRAVAFHHGLEEQIDAHLVKAAFAPDSPHNQDNPLGRIPVLQTDDGQWLFNSNLIAEYLDSIGTGSRLYPQDAARWPVLNLHALAEGILENTMPMVAERMLRPQPEWWVQRHEQMQGRNERALKALAEQLVPWGTQLNIGTLFSAIAIDYLLFRDVVIDARDVIVELGLSRWAADMNEQHRCLSETAFRAPG